MRLVMTGLFAVGMTVVFGVLPIQGQQLPQKPESPGKASGGSSTSTVKVDAAKSQKTVQSPAVSVGPPKPPTLQEMLAKAAQLLKDQKPLDAAKVYRETVVLYPTAYQPYDRLARLTISTKNYNEAVDAARKAVQYNTTDQAELVQEYSILGTALEEQGHYADARAAADHCIEMVPNNVDYRLFRGEIDMRAKDYAGAQGDYLAALGLSPDNYRVHSALGDVYEQENRHQSALQEYEAALRAVDAGSAPALEIKSELQMSEATALAGLKRFAEAEAEVRALLSKTPDNPTVQSALAQVLDAAGKHDEAISEYKTALIKSGNDAIVWGNLGWAEYNAGKYDDALQSSRKALELDPKQAYVRFNIGLIFAVRNQWSEAQKEYQAAIAAAAEPDIRAAINDIRDAMEKNSGSLALGQALNYLTGADHKALGFAD